MALWAFGEGLRYGVMALQSLWEVREAALWRYASNWLATPGFTSPLSTGNIEVKMKEW